MSLLFLVYDPDLHMTMTFMWHWPTYDLDLRMILTFILPWPLRDIDLHMTLTYIWHWLSYDPDFQMTLTIKWPWLSDHLDLQMTLTLRWIFWIILSQFKEFHLLGYYLCKNGLALLSDHLNHAVNEGQEMTKWQYLVTCTVPKYFMASSCIDKGSDLWHFSVH